VTPVFDFYPFILSHWTKKKESDMCGRMSGLSLPKLAMYGCFILKSAQYLGMTINTYL
jgi:hypothetical protein